MPCTKCKDDKYKWGKTGECEYATKEACESANHKYSKMKPTPLGKKTYAEYEKELKEFNLSKVERVDLGLIEDAQKLAQKNYSAYISVSKKAKGLSKISDTVEKLQTTFKQLDGDLSSQIDTFNKSWDSMEKKTKTAIKAAKELGLENEGPIKALKTNIEDAKKYWGKIKDVMDEVDYVKSRLF
jgi:hypothetical protein